jgi:hypothetical protein
MASGKSTGAIFFPKNSFLRRLTFPNVGVESTIVCCSSCRTGSTCSLTIQVNTSQNPFGLPIDPRKQVDGF